VRGAIRDGRPYRDSNPIGRFLKKITVPVLVMHGDDDQIAPYADSAPLSAKLLRNSTLKTNRGFPHGMPTTEAGTISADLLTFLKGALTTAAA
jgi:non-heme chloroperoxidase